MTGIHDSIFVRTIVFDIGSIKTAIVSADLLIIHPELTAKLNYELATIGWNKNHVGFKPCRDATGAIINLQQLGRTHGARL